MAGTEIINIAPGRVIIHITGLRELSRALSDFKNKDVPKIFAREIKSVGDLLADSAQSNAMSFGKSADFAASIGVTGGRAGIFLRSTDPGAGAIEFASAGATVTVPAHTRAGFPVKAYTRKANLPGDAPRALFKAIESDLPAAASLLGEIVERMAQTVIDNAEVN